jgi:SNF2 family DNA or RNA helicase
MPEKLFHIIQKYGAVYMKKKREWLVDIHLYPLIKLELQKFCRRKWVILNTIPEQVFELFSHRIPFSFDFLQNIVGYNYQNDILRKPSLKQLPTNLFNSLYDFQKVGVQFGIDNHGRCLIGDEMGVGKTIQAISIAYLYRKDWPLMIICPSSLRLTWRDEILTWCKGFIDDTSIQICMSSYEDLDPSKTIYIASYQISNRLAPVLERT